MFKDPITAQDRFEKIAGYLPPDADGDEILSHLKAAIAAAPDPDRVLVQVERFTERTSAGSSATSGLTGNGRQVEMLVGLLAASPFITEILQRHPEYFDRLVEAQADPRRNRQLTRPLTGVEMERDAQEAVRHVHDYNAQKDKLRRFYRHALFKIAACDLLALWDLETVTEQLSHLADSVLRVGLDIAAQESGTTPAGFVVIGMGKLGGRELNYSSDIDLLFVAGADPMSYARMGERLIDVIGGVSAEGFIYRVDMRLRPWGRGGALVTTVDGFAKYLRTHARLWEHQALLKARVIAGNVIVGGDFLDRVSAVIFKHDEEEIRSNVIDMKGRIESLLSGKGTLWGDVKQGRGSIRDVEFLTQYLQLVHGSGHTAIRSANTLEALARIAELGFISDSEHRSLSEGYIFLRVLEHHLQLLHNRQTHSLPTERAELSHLAKRLHYAGPSAADDLIRRYEEYSESIREVYLNHVENQTVEDSAVHEGSVDPHVQRMSPDYATVFSADDISHHIGLTQRLGPDNLLEIEARELEGELWQVTIVGYDYVGELSLIAGLLLAYGLDIERGQVFTYAPDGGEVHETRPIIVDVFVVRPVAGDVDAGAWDAYAQQLRELVSLLHRGETEAAHEQLADLVTSRMAGHKPSRQLDPVSVEVDNTTDPDYTLMRIKAPDTMGFLYELTHALTVTGVNIVRVKVESVGAEVRDTLSVTDVAGSKLSDPERIEKLHAAVVLVKQFTHLIPMAPNPRAALRHFRLLIRDLFDRPDWHLQIASLERPGVLDALTTVLGMSEFLWRDFLRAQHEHLLPLFAHLDTLSDPRSRSDLAARLSNAIGDLEAEEDRIAALNAFKDREVFRIDMRYLLDRIDSFEVFSREITELAEVVVEGISGLSYDHAVSLFGIPEFEDGGVCPYTVCAVGKCGGREMGFASDLELLILYEANGTTSGPNSVTNAEFFDRMVQFLAKSLHAKRDGIFEVDLRLRPYGSAGSLGVSLASFRRYFAPGGPAWPYERQTLIKLRPITGDTELGQHVVKMRDEILTGMGGFESAPMRAMRQRQIRHLVTPGTINVKYSAGALVDLEYLIQGLQINYCRRSPALLRRTGTREAMEELEAGGLLAPEHRQHLDGAYVLFRRLIEALRMVRGNARDLTMPEMSDSAFSYLGRRLGYDLPDVLHQDVTSAMERVRDLSTKLLG